MNRHVKRFLSIAVVFMMCLSFASPVYANGKKIHYKIIFQLLDKDGNEITQVDYKEYDGFVGDETKKVRTTYYNENYGDFDLVSENATQKLVADKNEYLFTYKTYEAVKIKGTVQFTTRTGTVLNKETFELDDQATTDNPYVYQVPDTYTVDGVEYKKANGQPNVIKSTYYNDPYDNVYNIIYYNPNDVQDYDVQVDYVEEGSNNVLMQKSFHVNDKDYTYIAPSTMKINNIYYTLSNEQSPVINHQVTSSERHYTINYKAIDENSSYSWYIYKVDAASQKILGDVVEKEVQPGSQTTYDIESEVKDDSQIYQVDASMPKTLTHQYGDSDHISYVYYNLEGSTFNNSDYSVNIEYRNIANNEVISTSKVNVEANKDEDTILQCPEKLSQDGQEYVLVDGQTASMRHSYYSPRRLYIVYYRNVNDALNADTEIITEQVIDVTEYNNEVTTRNAVGATTIYARNNQTGTNQTVGIQNSDGSLNQSNDDSNTSVDGVTLQDEQVPRGNIDASSTKETTNSKGIFIAFGSLALLLIFFILFKRNKDKQRKEG